MNNKLIKEVDCELNKLNHDHKERNSEIKDIFKDTEYIEWLINFSEKYFVFFDREWFYDRNKIAKKDMYEMRKLSLLYEGIDNYAKNNYLYPTPSTNGEGISYKIKFNDTYLEIGVTKHFGISFWCAKLNIIDDKDIDFNGFIIDFMKIINNEKLDFGKEWDEDLDSLKQKIVYLYEKGIPLETIINNTNKAFSEINNQKIYVKK